MNIDFFKYNHHAQTEEYLDMLHSNNISPIITKPTRITNHTATLIDHIYTNNTNQMISGIATVDISDHLPTFCIADIPLQKQNSMILPYLYYCNLAWCGTYKTNLQRIVILQKRAVRIVNKSTYDANTGPIFKKLELLKLHDIHLFQLGFFLCFLLRTLHSLLSSITFSL